MGGFTIWHGVVGLALLANAAAVAFFAARRAERERDAKTGITPGFKGWLMGLAAALVAAPLLVLLEAGWTLMTLDQRPYVAAEVVASEVSGAVALFAVTLTTAVVVMRRSMLFRPVFYVQCAVLLLLPVLGFVMTGEGGEPADMLLWAVGLALALACILYVARSRRVAVTFVR